MSAVREYREALENDLRIIVLESGAESATIQHNLLLRDIDAYALAVHVDACEEPEELVYSSTEGRYVPEVGNRECGDGWLCDKAKELLPETPEQYMVREGWKHMGSASDDA